jgi:hypothetical protein
MYSLNLNRIRRTLLVCINMRQGGRAYSFEMSVWKLQAQASASPGSKEFLIAPQELNQPQPGL